MAGGRECFGTLWALFIAYKVVKAFFPNRLSSHCSTKYVGFLPSTFSGRPTIRTLLHLILFSRSSTHMSMALTSLALVCLSLSRGGACLLCRWSCFQQCFFLSLNLCKSCLIRTGLPSPLPALYLLLQPDPPCQLHHKNLPAQTASVHRILCH